MKQILILFLWAASGCSSVGQTRFESFPPLSNFIDSEFSQANNIFPIATVSVNLDGRNYKIPISYSMLYYGVDSSNFLIKGEFIDSYSFKILDNGKFKPMFKPETLLLPNDWIPYLAENKNRFDIMKSKVDLNNYIKFLNEPDWWQNDATPFCEDGSPMKFICQVELGDFTMDDCCLFIFFDSQKKLVKQIYQRD